MTRYSGALLGSWPWVAVLATTVAATGAMTVGCSDAVPLGVSSGAGALIMDGEHGTPAGTLGFTFLPPILPGFPGRLTGTFEAGATPTVQIDRIDPVTGATIAAVATFDATTGGAERVRRHVRPGFYIVRWHTGRYGLDPGNTYRVRVLVGGGRELGVADVRAVRDAVDLRDLDRQVFVGVKIGDILPIKFRIDSRAVDRDQDGVLDWQDNCPDVFNPAPATGSQSFPTLATPLGCDYNLSDCDPQETDCLPAAKPQQTDTDGDGLGDACECLNVTCQASDACHGAGTCDPTTGQCSNPPLPDTDGDGVCDVIDGCPSDPEKSAPGLCGCGVVDSDIDTDADGTIDCKDECPTDPLKVTPGLCGCGVVDSDIDTDTDGTIDCRDECPTDPAKVTKGLCGCGVVDSDIDTDADGTIDCKDECPTDPAKVTPGLCGCGVVDSDIDTDGDGTIDCKDECPTDPAKVTKGLCGCGVVDSDIDTDADGTIDCKDGCPTDPSKVTPGLCGCGIVDVDIDTDGDGTRDCRDACPTDPAKVDPQHCGCNIGEMDTDGNGVVDRQDACPAQIQVLKCAYGAGGQSGATHDGIGGAGGAGGDEIGGGGGGTGGTPSSNPDGGVDGPNVFDAALLETAAPVAKPSFVDITWMSIANIYYEVGDLRILTDGYITRIPMSNFYGGRGGLQFTHTPSKPDVDGVTRVLDALGGSSAVNLLLAGHSHFDHTFDTATWSRLTSAPIIGSRTTCYQARAQGTPASCCYPVNGTETLTLSDSVTMRVVRWNHSGTSTSNPEQHNPVELDGVPTVDPLTGGLRGGVGEDYPNGGGGRAFLFTVDGADGPFSWFFQNSADTSDLEQAIKIKDAEGRNVDYGAPLDNLRAAMADARLDGVDLWIGTGGKAVAQKVVDVIKPKAYLPVHWEGLYRSPFVQLTSAMAFKDTALETYLATKGVTLLKPTQYMDKWRLDRTGVQSMDNTAIKQALGLSK